jgi:hypothetical protein
MCEKPETSGVQKTAKTSNCCCDGKFGLDKRGLEDLLSIKREPGRPRLDPEEMTNPLKAGRTRANRETVLGGPCQWAGLKYAGGGIKPLVGCLGNDAVARHHGPDKGTLNNEVRVNLHDICTSCHNRWHALNDEYYDKPRPRIGPWLPRESEGVCKPHDPVTKADPADQLANEVYWATPKAKRAQEDVDLTQEIEYATLDVEKDEDENDQLLGSIDLA